MKGQGCAADPTSIFNERNLTGLFFKNASFKSDSPFLIRQIEYYQRFIDPENKKRLGVKKICRFTPTCSEYTKRAIKQHGALRGIAMGVLRIMRCSHSR